MMARHRDECKAIIEEAMIWTSAEEVQKKEEKEEGSGKGS